MPPLPAQKYFPNAPRISTYLKGYEVSTKLIEIESNLADGGPFGIHP